jgi:chemotaxis protein methyltransferase WspC
VDILWGLLRENGILFLGHAETGVLLDSHFFPVNAKGSFAFRKLKRNEARPLAMTDTQKIFRDELERQLAARKRKYVEKEKRVEKKTRTRLRKKPERDIPKTEVSLKTARAFADKGMLEEAEEACGAYITENKLDSDAYFLMGIITMSLRKYSEAEGFFNKAVYLKPAHYDALLNLSAIRERVGDHDGALRFRQRAERISGFDR